MDPESETEMIGGQGYRREPCDESCACVFSGLKEELVGRAEAGESVRSLSAETGVLRSSLYQWLEADRAMGPAGLNRKRGRPRKDRGSPWAFRTPFGEGQNRRTRASGRAAAAPSRFFSRSLAVGRSKPKPSPRYPAPYSPDFNPIKKLFAKLKALLRKAAERTVEGLWNAIGKTLKRFTPHECANYFEAAGYEPT